MTTFTLRDTVSDLSTTAPHDWLMDTGTGTAASYQDAVTGSGTNFLWLWWTPQAGIGVLDWPTNAAWSARIDISEMGSAITLGGLGGSCDVDRVSQGGTSRAFTSMAWDSTVGTGLKTATQSSWAAPNSSGSRATTDRVRLRIGVTTSNTMMSNTITIASLNTTTTYMETPFSSGAAIALAGSAAATSTASANLSKQVSLSGSASGSATATGDLSVQGYAYLAGAAGGSSSAAAVLSLRVGLKGTAAGMSSAFGGMGPGLIEHLGVVGSRESLTSSSPTTITFSSATQAGDFLVCMFGGGGTNADLYSMVDSAGNTWQLDHWWPDLPDGDYTDRVYVLSCRVTTPHSVGSTLSLQHAWKSLPGEPLAGLAGTAIILGFRGIATSDWFDVSADYYEDLPSTTPIYKAIATPNTANTDVSSELLVGVVWTIQSDKSPFTPETVFPEWNDVVSAYGDPSTLSGNQIYATYRQVDETGAYRLAGTIKGGSDTTAIIATYRIAGFVSLQGSAQGLATAMGLLRAAVGLKGLASGTSSAIGTLGGTIHSAAASATASATSAAELTGTIGGAAASSASATSTADLTLVVVGGEVHDGAATASAAATSSAAGSLVHSGFASAVASASGSGAPLSLVGGSASAVATARVVRAEPTLQAYGSTSGYSVPGVPETYFTDDFERETGGGGTGDLIFEDTFTRTVSGGIGNPSAYSLVTNTGAAPNVNGSELVLAADAFARWNWTSGQTVASGLYEFDIYVGVVEDYWYLYNLTTAVYADGRLSIMTYCDDGNDWAFFAGSISATWQPTGPDKWFTVKVEHDRGGGGQTRAKIWERGTSEPDWMWSALAGSGGSGSAQLLVGGGETVEGRFDNLRYYELAAGGSGGIGDDVNYDLNFGPSQVVDGVLVVPAGEFTTWTWLTAPDDPRAEYQFDFYVPAGDAIGSAYQVTSEGGISLTVAHYSDSEWHINIGGTSSVQWYPDPATWYTVKASFDPIEGLVRVKVWEQGTPEPGTWLSTQSITFFSPTSGLLVGGSDFADAKFDNFTVTSIARSRWVAGGGGASRHPRPRINIMYDGTDITNLCVISEARFTARANGGVGDADIVIKDATQVEEFATGKTLELWIDGRREWDGWVTNLRRSYWFEGTVSGLTPRKFRLIGADRNLLLTRRVMYNKADPDLMVSNSWPEGTMDREVILDSVDRFLELDADGLNTTTKVEEIAAVDPYQPFKLPGPGAYFGDLMRRVSSDVGGTVYYIDPDRFLIYTDVNEPNAPFDLSDAPDGQIGFREVTVLSDASRMVNDAMIWGSGLGSNEVIFTREEDATSIALHGRWQNQGGWRQSLWKQESIDRIANSIVYGSPSSKRGHKDDAVSVTCTLYEPGLRVGQKVQVEVTSHDFIDVLPIREMTMTFPTAWEVKYDLRLSHELDQPWSTIDPWRPDPPECEVISCQIVGMPVGGGAGSGGTGSRDDGITIIDNFNRYVSEFWGTASSGGDWLRIAQVGPEVELSVNGGEGYIEWPGPSGTAGVRLPLTTIPMHNGYYCDLRATVTPNGQAWVEVWDADHSTPRGMAVYLNDNGGLAVRVVRRFPGSDEFGLENMVPGISMGQKIEVRMRMTWIPDGTFSGTALVKVWPWGGSEPEDFLEFGAPTTNISNINRVEVWQGGDGGESSEWDEIWIENYVTPYYSEQHVTEEPPPCYPIPTCGPTCVVPVFDHEEGTDTFYRATIPYTVGTATLYMDGLLLDRGVDWDEHAPGQGLVVLHVEPTGSLYLCFEGQGVAAVKSPLLLPDTATDGKFILPVSGSITGTFGPQSSGVWGGAVWHGTYYSSFHNGVDFGVASGNPVYAAAGGYVGHETQAAGGTMIHVFHPNGMRTTYAHLSSRVAAQGSTVVQGQLIGYSGSTGMVTGANLHWGLVINGSPEDPMRYV